MGRKKKSKQSEFRSVKFQFDQYWNVQYTEKKEDGSEKDYKTVIRARSCELAKEILKKKIKSDFPKSKVKSVMIYMFHKDGEINDNPLCIKDWAAIKESAFPNEVNVLFRYENPRPEGFTNRFNAVTQGSRPNNGFKKGHAYIPKRKQYSAEEKSHMIYKDGKWRKWPKAEREALKEKIIINFKLHNNSRGKTAKALGYTSPKALKKLLDNKFTEIDWNKEYPLTRIATSYNSKMRKEGIRKAVEKRMANALPKIKKLIEQNVPRKKIAKILNMSTSTIKSYLNHDNNN